MYFLLAASSDVFPNNQGLHEFARNRCAQLCRAQRTMVAFGATFFGTAITAPLGGVSRTGTRGDSQSAQFHGHVIGPSIGGPIRAHVNLRAVFFVTASLLLGCAGLNRWTRGES